jgi:hypothetical protein
MAFRDDNPWKGQIPGEHPWPAPVASRPWFAAERESMNANL